jgi:TetR/AcrR family transcriptional repressor of nem operon
MKSVSNTRQQIIDKAAQLMLQRGLNGFSYRDISEPLGVKNAAIHYHFPSKADLALALIEDYQETLRRQTAEFMAYGGPARPQLEGMFSFTRQQCACGRPICMAGALTVDFEDLNDETRNAMDQVMKETVSWLTHVVETGREQNEFQFKGSARPKAISILAIIQGARQLARIHGINILEDMFVQIRTDLGITD